MATQTRSPSTVTEGVSEPPDQSWINPNNVKVSDNVYAVGIWFDLEQMEALICEDFGFTIPTGATINSIVIHVEQFYETGSGDVPVIADVFKGVTQGLFGNTLATLTEQVIDFVEFFVDGSDPLWGLTWTAEEINSDFIVNITQDHTLDSSGTLTIDHISVTVDYTEGSPPVPFESRYPTMNARW